MKKIAMGIVALAAAAQPVQAAKTIVEATGSGWRAYGANDNGEHGNLDLNVLSNYYSDPSERNWFHFKLPNVNIRAASLYIWNHPDYKNVDTPKVDTYTLRVIKNIETYDAMLDGPVVNVTRLSKVNAGGGTFVRFNLRDAKEILGGLSGQSVIFGGEVSSINYYSAFGSTDDRHVPYLVLSTGVPEPATWAMMIVGFGVVAGSLRRRSYQLRQA